MSLQHGWFYLQLFLNVFCADLFSTMVVTVGAVAAAVLALPVIFDADPERTEYCQ